MLSQLEVILMKKHIIVVVTIQKPCNEFRTETAANVHDQKPKMQKISSGFPILPLHMKTLPGETFHVPITTLHVTMFVET